MDAQVQEQEGTDVPLVLRAQGGDTAAFGELVRRFQRQVVNLSYRLLGNTEDARDVGQETFVRAFRSLRQLDDPGRFAPWLMRTASNLALNFRRSRRLRLTTPLDDATVGVSDGRSPTSGRRLTVSEETEGELPDGMHDTVSEALAQLPDKQRLALILFSVEGMPQKDVAEILECSVDLVKWNVFQARKKLKDLLAQYL